MHDERMDKASSDSARCIKVEYHDPDNAFRLVKADFERRLPLRNLNWNTSNRPFRSIASLNVDLQSDTGSSSLANDSATNSSAGVNTGPNNERPQTIVSRSQRHQIPGLRQTPYLKIYFLTCQSSEEYKLSARRQLRDWIKAIAAKHNSGKATDVGEHDAFEWLIVHVVTPQSIGGTEWPSKSSNSVLEKLKSDFNGSSKGAVDRVCQIASTNVFASNQVASLPVSLGKDTFLLHLNQAWEDVLHKMKGLVHAAFELRVQQYESDIKAKLAQSSIPGWNFCLYFLLKEGLARGFEDMGLREDALITYGQLSDELDDIVINDSPAPGDVSATSFRSFSPLIEKLARGTASENDFTFSHNGSASVREKILANNVSKLELATYVFARQCELRLGWSGRDSTAHANASDIHETMQQLTEIYCQTLSIIVTKTFLVISELSSALEGISAEQSNEIAVDHTYANNCLQSWIYMVADQSLQSSPGIPNKQLEPKQLSSMQIVDELARLKRQYFAARAKLYLVARAALVALAMSRRWTSGLVLLQELLELGPLQESVQKDGAFMNNESPMPPLPAPTKLRIAFQSRTTFSELLMEWSEKALQLLDAAEETSTRDKLQIELVAASMQSGNFSIAADVLRDLAPMYLRKGWNQLALLCYQAYTRCLEELARPKDLIPILLTLCTIPTDKYGVTPAKTPSSYFTKAIDISKSLKDDIIIPELSILKVTKIASDITHRPGDDTLVLVIELFSPHNQSIRLDALDLRLIPVTSGDGQTVSFGTTTATILTPGDNVLELSSTIACLGSHKVSDVSLRFEKLVFKSHLHVTPGESFIKGSQFVLVQKPNIMLWPRSGGVEVHAYVARHVQLDLPMSVIFDIRIGDKHAERADLFIKPGSAGLRLHIENAIRLRSDGGEEKLAGMSLGTCKAHTRHRVQVPFTLDGNIPVLILKAQLDYQYTETRHSLRQRFELPCSLPIAVNVQDTHRANFTLSKFAISSAIPSPLCIEDHNLTGLDGFECTSGSRPTTRMTMATMSHPFIATYKVRRVQEQHTDIGRGGLLFKVHYGLVAEILIETILEKFASDIRQSTHANFSRFVLSNFKQILLAELGPPGFEKIFHTRYWASANSLHSLCDQVNDAFTSVEAMAVADWLQSWADTNQRFLLPAAIPEQLSRSLTVPMDVPESKALVELHIALRPNIVRPGGNSLGEIIPIEIICQSTRTIGHEYSSEGITGLRIEVEIYPDDSWLVAGSRRMVAPLERGGIVRRSLQLLCLRRGCISFPRIDAQLFKVEQGADGFLKQEALASEICYLNSNETLLIA